MTNKDTTEDTTQKAKDTAKSLLNQARSWVREGSNRHVIFRKQDGSKLFEMNLAATVLVALLLLFFAGWLLVIAVVGGYLMNIRLEIIHEIDDQTTIEIDEE